MNGKFKNNECFIPLNITLEDLTVRDLNEDNSNHVFYCLFVSFLIIFQIYSTILLINKISDNFTNSNSVSLYTVGQNTIWNAYGCLFHFFIAVNNEVKCLYK